MSCTPTVWNTGDTITAEKLNKLENGVANVGGYDIVFALTDGVLTADGASLEELIAKYPMTKSLYVEGSNCYTGINHCIDEYEGIASVIFSYYDTQRGLQIEFLLSSDGTAMVTSGFGQQSTVDNYTYTYSNGHYVFTESGT